MRSPPPAGWTRRGTLLAVSFGANAVALSVELLATRLLFPQYGNTLFTWSSVITMIIAGFFLGSLAGGLAADRRSDRWGLVAAELGAAGLLVLLIPVLRGGLFPSEALPGSHPPLASSFLCFGVPAALLAATGPALVAALTEEEGLTPSWAAGLVSALAAAGSIAGTLATAFMLIPAWGVRPLLLAEGAALGAAGLAVYLARGERPRPAPALAALAVYAGAALAAGGAGATPPGVPDGRLLFSKDSAYQLVRVYETGAGPDLARILMLDSTWEGALSASGDMVFEYTRAWSLFPLALSGRREPRVLFIGGGAYSMPLRVARTLEGSRVEVAEIDPAVEKAGRDYFGAASAPNLRTLLADGRQALAGEGSRYDGIFVDAYHGVMSIPFHLTTREFFQRARAALRPDGLIALNVIGDVGESQGLFCALAQTAAAEFPHLRIYPVHGAGLRGAQNIILVAALDPRVLPPEGEFLSATRFSPSLPLAATACRPGQELTDDHAPVEWLVLRYQRKQT